MRKPVVITGAGVTGLSIACLLAENGIPTVLIEKDDEVGGLARSFRYDGFTFDIGPHRFHTDVADVDSFVRGTLGGDGVEIGRNSQVHFMDHYYPWPLRPSHLVRHFPPRIALLVIKDLLTLYKKKDPLSFQDQIENMYGKTLFRHFFEGYSSKFLGIVPKLTDSDWASTGIDRAIIDKRLEMSSLWQIVFATLRAGKMPDVKFIYPKGGNGVFTDILADRFKAAGGRLILGSEVRGLETRGDRIVAVELPDETIEPSMVVWTGTVHALTDLLDMERPELDYLALVCFNMMLTDGERREFQWCYHGAPEISFSRVSIPENFHPDNVPEGKRSYCVEWSCREGDPIWQNPENYLERVITDMKKVQLLKTSGEVIDVKYQLSPWAYPIYKLGYRDDLAKLDKEFKKQTNLIPAGRLGSFWYNNMDHCIESAINTAAEISKRFETEKKSD